MKKEDKNEVLVLQRNQKILIILLIILFSLNLFAFYKLGYVDKVISIFNKNTNNSSSFDSKYYTRKSMLDSLPVSNNKIIFLGDSITAGCEWSEVLENNDIINRGIPDDTTSGIIERLNNIIENKPSKIFIMIGINDISKGVSDDIIIENYYEIIDKINNESPNTKIYIQSILPVNKDIATWFSSNNSRISKLNNKILQICYDKQIEYINLYDIMIDEKGNLNSDYTIDGVHLNGNGYKVWSEYIIDFFN